MNSLIILAGGEGQRAKQKIPKQFIYLSDQEHPAHRLLYNQYGYIGQSDGNFRFDEVITVVHKNWIKEIQKELEDWNNTINKVVPGGSSRTESSYIGLKACSKECKNVLIHDSARLFAGKKIFDDCIDYLENFDSVVPIITHKDTTLLKNNRTIEYLNRTTLKLIQTPQAFKYNLIRKAYDNLTTEKTDDLQILLNHKPNISIKFIDGLEKNFKITTHYEINLLRELYKNNTFWKTLSE